MTDLTPEAMSEPSAEAVIKAYGIVGENTVMLSSVLGEAVVRVSSLCDAIARAIGPKRPTREQLVAAANLLGRGRDMYLDDACVVAAFLRELAEE